MKKKGEQNFGGQIRSIMGDVQVAYKKKDKFWDKLATTSKNTIWPEENQLVICV